MHEDYRKLRNVTTRPHRHDESRALRSQRATTRDVRRGNRAMLLRELYFEGPLSRQDLIAVTGLSSGSVSNLVADLLAEEVVTEVGQVESDGGRPRVLLQVNPAYGHTIGVDVGETGVRVELFDLAMTQLAKAEYPLVPDHHEVDLVRQHILAGIDSVLSMRGIANASVLGVGIGVPGVVEQAPQLRVHAQTIGWDGVPLAAPLQEATGLAMFVDNGAKTLGQAEVWYGAGWGSRNAVVALIGTGVGASIIADGAIYRGTSSSAGEWGHTKVAVNGRICRCGGRGCLEAYVGGKSIIERYLEAAPGAGLDSDDEEGTLAHLLTLAQSSTDAGRVIGVTIDYLGAGLANLINMFNPEKIILAGWAGMLLGKQLLPDIRRATAKHSLAQPYAQTTIQLAQFGTDAVALGAATLVIDQFLNGNVSVGAASNPKHAR